MSRFPDAQSQTEKTGWNFWLTTRGVYGCMDPHLIPQRSVAVCEPREIGLIIGRRSHTQSRYGWKAHTRVRVSLPSTLDAYLRNNTGRSEWSDSHLSWRGVSKLIQCPRDLPIGCGDPGLQKDLSQSGPRFTRLLQKSSCSQVR